MTVLEFQAVLLAGGDDKRLYPLSSGVVGKALLPVANKALISYPLQLLASAGLKHAFVVVAGEKAASSIATWLSAEFNSPDGLQCEVVTVPEEYGTADALRAVAPKISAKTFVVLSGDLLTDVTVDALVASHQMRDALATVVLYERKVSPSSLTKPGKAPKNVDYVGLDPSSEHLLFYASSQETLRDLKVPMSVIMQHGHMNISSNFADAHLYIFDRSLLSTLEMNPSLSSLRQDLLPFLTQQQVKMTKEAAAQQRAASLETSGLRPAPSMSLEEQPSVGDLNSISAGAPLPGADYMSMSHGGPIGGAPNGGVASTPEALLPGSGGLGVYVIPSGKYCTRVYDPQTFSEVNREVADPGTAMHLSGMKPSKFDNSVGAGTTIGNKATIASACFVGEHCTLGDKTSIKRSVVGNNVKLGSNVKVINSVIMDTVVVGDGCIIQNTVLCSSSQVKDKSSLKDCQIGHGYVVPSGAEYKDEVLAKDIVQA